MSARSAARFRHLLQPGRIGTMTVRNRLVMSPMETMYGTPDGLPSQRTRDYFAARARGGVGLITVGATGIDPHHPETPGVLEAGKTIAPEIGNKRKTEHMDRLDRLGVMVHVRAPVARITRQGLIFHAYNGDDRALEADNVVLAGTLDADTSLFDELTVALPDVKVSAAGDCRGLGLIRKATEDGARAACAI